MPSSDDLAFMRRALRLARRGLGHTAPNPPVGAVIVRRGVVVGEGWHRAAGREHAEIVALARAGRRAEGATLYVTLEPCAHWGRTPPCADAIVASGIARCVVALRDPHDIVDGRGLRRLRAGGVRVELGTAAREARELAAGYLCAMTIGRPRITWKVATSLDGRIADPRGRSKWITGPEARARGHRLRAQSDAIVVGAGTVRADDPRLTVRGSAARGARAPLRVVVDSSLALPGSRRLFRSPLARGTVVACTTKAPAARRRALESRGVTVWSMPAARGRVSLPALARRLAREGCCEVLLEGGATLGTAFLRDRLVDRLVLGVGPRVLGDGLAWSGPLGVTLASAPRARLVSLERAGHDVWMVLDLEGGCSPD